MEIKKLLEENRPSLKDVAPLTYYIVIGFSVFNVSLALTYPLILSKIEQLHRVTYLDIKGWVLVFALYGLALGYFLYRNDWNHCKKTLIAGTIIKSAWLLQLISSSIIINSRFLAFAAAVWCVLLYIKIFTYIYFTPELGVSKNE